MLGWYCVVTVRQGAAQPDFANSCHAWGGDVEEGRSACLGADGLSPLVHLEVLCLPRLVVRGGTVLPYSFHQAVKASMVGPRPLALAVIA